jgi:hypothetical protein
MRTSTPQGTQQEIATRDMTDSAHVRTLYITTDEGGLIVKDERIGSSKLQLLTREISDRDIEILRSARDYRYLTTGQIRRLHFRGAASDIAALRAANRILAKLKGLNLLRSLDRRIGGVRAGSASFVWTLSPVGSRLLASLEDVENPTRKRFREPSLNFLEHTLAVAELSIRLLEMGFEDGAASLLKQELEPDCWRAYTGLAGAAKTLKPDLYAVTSSGEYEDHWFFEVDLATHSPVQVIRKCEQYIAYRRLGVEQHGSGVFPSVVWLVSTEKRKNSLKRHISDMRRNTEIFTVVTMNELYSLIEHGADGFRKMGEQRKEGSNGR